MSHDKSHPVPADALLVTDVTAARTLFVRDCPVRATFVEWGERVLMIGGHERGGHETKGSVVVLDPSTMAPPVSPGSSGRRFNRNIFGLSFGLKNGVGIHGCCRFCYK